MDTFTIKDGKKLRCGYTTGTCAAGAAKAAAVMALSREEIHAVRVTTPKGITLMLAPEDIAFVPGGARCAIRKDAGDDPDITNGALVYADVRLIDTGIRLHGGIGVGTVTKPGLACDVGEPAINPVPQRMICTALQDTAAQFHYTGGFDVTVSIPGGEELAKKTFNPRLGIEGGLSILGTSGIVEPMSERAIVETIHTEMDSRFAEGDRRVLAFFGNYGVDFSRNTLGIDVSRRVTISNYVGEMLDYAVYKGFSHVLLIGHAGKLVKVAQGIMNTHSRYADGRTALLALEAVFAGADTETARAVYESITTDEAIRILLEKGILSPVMAQIMEKIDDYMAQRTHHEIRTGAIMFSNIYGVLGKTAGADEMLSLYKKKEGMP